jgi:membrane-bound metal-dependent hydrolase YbcI (DUF457 family)
MLLKTHYVILIFFVLLLLPSVEHKIIFVITALIATQLPDIDSRYSKLGHRKLARILQIFTKHRGMIHSFTFLLSITIVLILIFPVLGFGFFLGYGMHLFSDSFTKEGIRPFYPFKKRSCGVIRTGGKIEIVLLILFFVLDLWLIFIRFF